MPLRATKREASTNSEGLVDPKFVKLLGHPADSNKRFFPSIPYATHLLVDEFRKLL